MALKRFSAVHFDSYFWGISALMSAFLFTSLYTEFFACNTPSFPRDVFLVNAKDSLPPVFFFFLHTCLSSYIGLLWKIDK